MKISPISTQPVINAERFDLRPLRASDAGLIEMNASDKRVAMYTSAIPHPLPPGTTEAYIARAMADGRDEDIWAMDGSNHNACEVMGVISLKRLEHDHSEIAYWVAPAYWNTGIASEAVEALVTANPHDAEVFFAAVSQDNRASARVLMNGGFTYIGDAETYSVARGAKVPTWTYSKRVG